VRASPSGWRGLADDRFPRYHESAQLPPLAINQRGMHMSLTRRTALTAIAATSATGGLATAVGSPYSADPIFAAIEAHKAAMKEWRRLDTEFDEQRRKAVRQPLAPICQLRQRISVSGDWDRRAGIADFRARAEEAHETERDAAERLAEIMPTTVAGATALLVHVLDEALDEVCGDLNPTDQETQWLINATEALKELSA
jgi:hypothetical protein